MKFIYKNLLLKPFHGFKLLFIYLFKNMNKIKKKINNYYHFIFAYTKIDILNNKYKLNKIK